MNKTILKIANLISMSPQSGKESGLMGGKMGRTLFYYELSRMTGIKSYNDMADLFPIFNRMILHSLLIWETAMAVFREQIR